MSRQSRDRPKQAGRTWGGSFSVLGLLLVLVSCSDEERPPGLQGDLGRGGQCSEQMDCFECFDCRRPYQEICVEGLCWLSSERDPEDQSSPLLGHPMATIELPSDVAGFDASKVRSAAVRVFHPARVDGNLLTCHELLDDTADVDHNPAFNRLRVLEPPLPPLHTGDDIVNLGAGHVAVGEDRIFFVRLHEFTRGEGPVLAIGCTEGVFIAEGMGQQVIITAEEVN